MKRLPAALALLVWLVGIAAAPVTPPPPRAPQAPAPLPLQQVPPLQSPALQQPTAPTGRRTGPAPTFTPTQKIPANGAVSFPVDI